MNPLTSIKFVFVCKALAWRAYLTIFLLYQHNNIKRNPRMRWWVIDTIWSLCLVGPSFVIEIRVLPPSILCHRRKDRKFELFMRHRGWGSSVLGFPVSPVLWVFDFPSFHQEMKPAGTRCHAKVVPISTDTTWRRVSQSPFFSLFW